MAHWKDHLNSDLLGAYSLFDDATEGFKEVNGMITKTAHEDHVLGASGKQKVFVAHTTLGKPLRLNNTMCNQIAVIAKTKNPAKWINVPVTFYVDTNVKLGRDTVDAIRIKAQNPVKKDFSAEEKRLRDCKTIEELAEVFKSDGFPQRELLSIKDEMKNKLTSE